MWTHLSSTTTLAPSSLSFGSACWQPLDICILGTPVLLANSGLREFLYRVYDVTFCCFRGKRVEFDYNEYDIVLNGHQRFPQKAVYDV